MLQGQTSNTPVGLVVALTCVALLAACTQDTVTDYDDAPPVDRPEDLAPLVSSPLPELQVHPNRRQLAAGDKDFFLLGDSAWAAVWKLGRSEVVDYFTVRQEQGYNAIAVRAFSSRHTLPNAYGDRPFGVVDGDWDFSTLEMTEGADPKIPSEYDYWDHLDYMIRSAARFGMYVLLSPVHGRFVSGDWQERSAEGILLDRAQAYELGNVFGRRYGDHSNVIWVVGGDRSPSTTIGNTEDIYHALAEGLADGVNGERSFNGESDYETTLMTYWPRKYRANSSFWFHRSPWLDFNSVQDMPRDQPNALAHDLSLVPRKPTFLFEGRYEGYTERWTSYQTRLQAYQSVFSGGFGFLFGHEITYFFGVDWTRREGDYSVWYPTLRVDGATEAGYLKSLFERLMEAVPEMPVVDQTLIEPEQRSRPVGDFASHRILGMRHESGAYALYYSPSGETIHVRRDSLQEPTADHFWFDPTSGSFLVAAADGGDGELIRSEPAPFTPPQRALSGNDWVLIVARQGLLDFVSSP